MEGGLDFSLRFEATFSLRVDLWAFSSELACVSARTRVSF